MLSSPVLTSTPSDLQTVNVTLRVLSKPDVKYLAPIYRSLGHDYDERVLPSIVNEVLKSVVVRTLCLPVPLSASSLSLAVYLSV